MSIASNLVPFLERFGVQLRATPATATKALTGGLSSEVAVDWLFNRVFAMADPDEVLRRAGIQRQHLRVMTSDDEISQTIDTRNDALVATAWRFETPAGTDQAAVDWLTDEFEDHVDTVLLGCMAALPYGFSVQEAIYKYDEDTNRLTWQAIIEKPFEWFLPQTDGTVLLRSKTNFAGEVVDPRKFFLTQRHPTYKNPYGEALFSRLYWPWFFRQQGWRFWVKWLERFGTPLLIGQGAGDSKELAKALAMAVQDAAIAVGPGVTIQAVQAAGGPDHFEKFDAVICRRIQKLVLGQTLTSDMTHAAGLGGTGAARVHDEVRMDKRDADSRMCIKTVQQLVNVLWALNGFAGDSPLFVLQDDTGLEDARATRDAKLATAGVCAFSEDYLVNAYDFEQGDIIPLIPNNGTDPTKPPPPVAAPFGNPTKPATVKNAAGVDLVVGPKFTAPQQVIEDRVAEVPLRAPIAASDIREAIMAANSPHGLALRLAQLFAGHPLKDFHETLERAMFAADVMGYAHAQLPTAQGTVVNVAPPNVVVNVPPPVAAAAPVVTLTAEAPDMSAFAALVKQNQERSDAADQALGRGLEAVANALGSPVEPVYDDDGKLLGARRVVKLKE